MKSGSLSLLGVTSFLMSSLHWCCSDRGFPKWRKNKIKAKLYCYIVLTHGSVLCTWPLWVKPRTHQKWQWVSEHTKKPKTSFFHSGLMVFVNKTVFSSLLMYCIMYLVIVGQNKDTENDLHLRFLHTKTIKQTSLCSCLCWCHSCLLHFNVHMLSQWVTPGTQIIR